MGNSQLNATEKGLSVSRNIFATMELSTTTELVFLQSEMGTTTAMSVQKHAANYQINLGFHIPIHQLTFQIRVTQKVPVAKPPSHTRLLLRTVAPHHFRAQRTFTVVKEPVPATSAAVSPQAQLRGVCNPAADPILCQDRYLAEDTNLDRPFLSEEVTDRARE